MRLVKKKKVNWYQDLARRKEEQSKEEVRRKRKTIKKRGKMSEGGLNKERRRAKTENIPN